MSDYLKEETRQVVATLSDKSVYKVPVAVILKRYEDELIARNDTDPEGEVKKAQTSDPRLIAAYANTIPWHEIKPVAKRIKGETTVKMKFAWRRAAKVVMTEKEVDNFLMQTVN